MYLSAASAADCRDAERLVCEISHLYRVVCAPIRLHSDPQLMMV
jgi:hypothetical protein